MYSGTGAVFSGKPMEIHFPNGGRLYTGHLKDDNAYTKYQGHEYNRILIEELTHIPTEELYLKLIASCRSTKGLQPRVFATTNPGGTGHGWVKKRFIDPSPPGKQFLDPISNRSRLFIPATVEDNPTILDKDPEYVTFLDSLPPDLREQWRKGNWNINVVKGAYFQLDLEQATREQRLTRVPYSPYQSVHVAFDLGISDDMTMIFYQVSGQEVKILRAIGDNQKSYAHYIQLLGELKIKYGYNYGKVIIPHDGEKRSHDTFKTFRMMLEEAGYTVEVMPRTNNKQGDIELVRSLFPRFWIDAEACSVLLEALAIYRRQYSEERGVYEDKPYHDWSSNYADALMVLAKSIHFTPKAQKPVPKNYGFKQGGYSKKIF